MWTNRWEEVYDFTPTTGNFKIMPASVSCLTVLNIDLISQLSLEGLSPVVTGSNPKDSKRTGLIKTVGIQNVPKGHFIDNSLVSVRYCTANEAHVRNCLDATSGSELSVVRTTKLSLTKPQVRLLIGSDKGSYKKEGDCYIVLHVAGPKSGIKVFTDQLSLHLPADDLFIASEPDAVTQKAQLVFETWRPSDS